MQAHTTEPYSVRLAVHRTGDFYEARWIEPYGQESEDFPLSLPLDVAKEDLHGYLEDYVGFVGGGDRVLAAEIEAKIQDWGRQLFAALFYDGRRRAPTPLVAEHRDGGLLLRANRALRPSQPRNNSGGLLRSSTAEPFKET